MARWHRAASRLDLPAGSRVLDLGCAFGFGTRLLLPRYQAFGHDLSRSYIESARRSVTGATFTAGPADRIPYSDDFFDGVLLLDVLEHVPCERDVLEETARVIRPQGRLILSVPNKGILASWDSLNVYRKLFGDREHPPTDDPSWLTSPCHRHYSASELKVLLAPEFRILSLSYGGIGLAEPVNLALLALFRRILEWPRVYDALQYLYFGVYLAEDVLTTGDWGYHLMVTAERV